MEALSQFDALAVKLNLGCSDRHLPEFLNVDRVPPCDLVADLSLRWPWEDSSVDYVQAYDIFEHLPSKIQTMNECYRVLRPGGNLDLFVPTTDGRGAFQDPTHVSFWTPNDLFYWCDQYAEWIRFHEAYGITARFRIVHTSHREYENRVWKLRALLQVMK